MSITKSSIDNPEKKYISAFKLDLANASDLTSIANIKINDEGISVESVDVVESESAKNVEGE